jgi:hypothetical protein
MPFLGGRGQASRGYFGAATTPGAPTSVVSTKGNGEISVAFTAPSFDGGLPITTYQYALSTDSYATFTTRSAGTTASPLVITGLTNGTSYGIKIRAVNSLGGGAASDAATAVIPSTVPNAPTITSSPSHVNGQVTVTWNALTGTDTGGAAILSYTLQHSSSSTFANNVVTVTGIASNSHTVSGLTNGDIRYFKVLGVNSNGDGAYSATANATPSTVPSAPATPTVNALDAGDTITWSALTGAATGGRAITGYYYKVSTNNGAYSGETFVAAGSTLSYATSNQYSAGTKKIQVRAENANGTSGFSTVSANTVAWAQTSQVQQNPTACPAPTCAACPAPTCAACNNAPASCEACSCDCGTASRTASSGTRGASTIGTRGAPTLGTSTRTCYRWERPAAGSTASGYVYAENSTSACGDYSVCTASTCGNCSAGTCGDCSAGSCSACSTCSGTRTNKTGDFSEGGIDYTYTGTPGSYYAFPNPTCGACGFSNAFYSVTVCLGTNSIALTSSEPCADVFGNPC